jgi:hypothetical protein
MNGRVYDPFTALFMSPDPYVASPSDWLNYNRYSYCLNNPFKYTDPSGKFVFLLVPFLVGAAIAAAEGAAIAGAFYTITTVVNGSSWNSNAFWKSVANGAISGAVTFGIGSAFGATGGAALAANVKTGTDGFLGISNGFLNEVGRAGAHALAQGVMTAADGGNFWSGAAAGAFGSISGHTLDALHVDFVANNPFGVVAFSAFSGGMGSVFAGGDFLEGAKSGAMIGALNLGHDKIQRLSNKIQHASVQVAHKVKVAVHKAMVATGKALEKADRMITGLTNDSNDPTMGVAQKVAVSAAAYMPGPTAVSSVYTMTTGKSLISGHSVKGNVNRFFWPLVDIGVSFTPNKFIYNFELQSAYGTWGATKNMTDLTDR